MACRQSHSTYQPRVSGGRSGTTRVTVHPGIDRETALTANRYSRSTAMQPATHGAIVHPGAGTELHAFGDVVTVL